MKGLVHYNIFWNDKLWILKSLPRHLNKTSRLTLSYTLGTRDSRSHSAWSSKHCCPEGHECSLCPWLLLQSPWGHRRRCVSAEETARGANHSPPTAASLQWQEVCPAVNLLLPLSVTMYCGAVIKLQGKLCTCTNTIDRSERKYFTKHFYCYFSGHIQWYTKTDMLARITKTHADLAIGTYTPLYPVILPISCFSAHMMVVLVTVCSLYHWW